MDHNLPPPPTLMNLPDQPQQPYQIGFKCEYNGSILRRSRWTVRWRFGIADPTALKTGKAGVECRGEEHEVHLIRFTRSKKSRLYWNKRNITHLFREAQSSVDVAKFAWQTKSGEVIHVTGGIVPMQEERSQYQLLIDGMSFASLPRLAEIGSPKSIQAVDDAGRISGDGNPSLSVPIRDSGSDPNIGRNQEEEEEEESTDGVEFRLSMVGLCAPEEEVVDELRSDLYSTTLDELRQQITECIPQTEEMISRAIISGFYLGDDSQTTLDSSSESFADIDFEYPMQLEVDALKIAYSWVSSQGSTHLPELDEQKLSILQRQIDSVVVQIRHDRLSVEDARHILSGVACILGLDVRFPAENSTVIVLGLDPRYTQAQLQKEMENYGEVEGACVATVGGFGICRFCDPRSVDLVEAAFGDRETLMCGSNGQVCSLTAVSGTVCRPRRTELQRDSSIPDSPEHVSATKDAAMHENVEPFVVTPENDYKKVTCFTEDSCMNTSPEVETSRYCPAQQFVYETVLE